MESLLRNEFTAHYGLLVSTLPNLSISTTESYFEIEDDANREIQLHVLAGGGMAGFRNVGRHLVTVINYDKFITGLPAIFGNGLKRCDLIVYSDNSEHFALCELKDRKPKSRVRAKSISQLLASLGSIMNVPDIDTFAKSHTFRRCCFFNKQSMSPPSITATTAFNRLNAVATNGLKMSNSSIEAFGFEFWEYSGNQVYEI
jgi:hypothetical protein